MQHGAGGNLYVMSDNSQALMRNLDKIGNLIIYLVDNIQEKYRQKVNLTKLLKLLYLVDEKAVKETGVPVTGLEYRVWRMGPVAYHVYKDMMCDKSEQLSFFAKARKERRRKEGQEESAWIKSVKEFEDSEFSDYEMNLIDRIIDQYGYLQGNALVELLHEEGSLWKRLVDERILDRQFEQGDTSSYKMDLARLVADDPLKLRIFRTVQESQSL